MVPARKIWLKACLGFMDIAIKRLLRRAKETEGTVKKPENKVVFGIGVVLSDAIADSD